MLIFPIKGKRKDDLAINVSALQNVFHNEVGETAFLMMKYYFLFRKKERGNIYKIPSRFFLFFREGNMYVLLLSWIYLFGITRGFVLFSIVYCSRYCNFLGLKFFWYCNEIVLKYFSQFSQQVVFFCRVSEGVFDKAIMPDQLVVLPLKPCIFFLCHYFCHCPKLLLIFFLWLSAIRFPLYLLFTITLPTLLDILILLLNHYWFSLRKPHYHPDSYFKNRSPFSKPFQKRKGFAFYLHFFPFSGSLLKTASERDLCPPVRR